MARPRKSVITDTIEVPITPPQDGGEDTYPLPPTNGNGKYPTLSISASGDATTDPVSILPLRIAGKLRTLEPWIDDVDRDFGWGGWWRTSIYDQMQNEPAVSASVGLLMASALGQPPDTKPARNQKVVKRGDPDYPQAARMARFVEANLSEMRTPFMPTLREIIEGAFTHGHKLGRKVYESGMSDDVGGMALYLREIHPKPNHATWFVMTELNQWFGVAFNESPPKLQPDSDGMVDDVEPPSLYVHAAYKPRNMDPRGTSGLRSAYHPWHMLEQLYESERRYNAIYGTPPIHSTLPPGAQDEIYDRTKNPPELLATPRKATEVQNTALKALRSAGIVTTQNGSTVTVLQPGGEGEFYDMAQSREIMRIGFAILFQTLATQEGRHQARSASQVHQDALAIRVRSIKTWAEEVIYSQIVRPLIEINFGKAFLHLCPRVTLGQVEVRDFAGIASAFAQLGASGMIPWDKLDEIFDLLGLGESDALSDYLEKNPEDALIPMLKLGAGVNSAVQPTDGGVDPPQPTPQPKPESEATGGSD